MLGDNPHPDRESLTPSMLGAVALHLAVLVSGLIVWPWFGKPIQIVNATAVTLVPSKAAPPPPALQAPEEHEAAAPEPTPKPAPPTPPPPPPQPKAQPKPAPEPTPPPPAATKPQPSPTPKPKPKQESLDLNALTSSLDKSAKTQAKPKPTRDSFDLAALANSLDQPSKPSAAARGPARYATAPTARIDPGAAQATNDAAQAVGARLNRIWNKSCGVEGFRDIVIHVKFNLTIDGQLLGSPEVLDRAPPGNSVWQAAADRATRAVRQATPFNELPRQTYNQWRTFTAIFDGKTACQNQ
jgi:protein TonB